MKFGKRDKSIVDALFLLALFGVFLISALFIVLFGAKIYKNTVKSSDESFIQRTCYTYISEKIRQNDNSNGVKIDTSGANSIITLSKTVNNKDYLTYLYCDEGFLKEYTTTAGNPLNKQSGNKIIELDKMQATECNKNLYKFSLEGSGINTSFYVSVTSDLGGALNE
ncbi:MAG: DUF4860 domain-containing protein [Lachnospiraceae bacterium]|nr:DUF4860 domain-containing protein [Lachnospiraceae bacterium]